MAMIEILQPNKKTIEVVGSGNSGSVVGVEKPYLVHDKPPVKSGIGYPPKLWSGEYISYNINDEGWRFSNLEFVRNNPINPLYMQDLDYSSAKPVLTLKHKNFHGNYNRFTDINGGVDFLDQDYFEDHLQGCRFVKLGYTDFYPSFINLNIAISIINGFEYNSIVGWSIANQMESYSVVRALRDANLIVSMANASPYYLQTSTPRRLNANYYMQIERGTLNTFGITRDYPSQCGIFFIKYFD